MEVWNTGKCVIDLWPTSNLNLFCILCTQILDMYVNKIDEHKVLKAVPYHCALQIYPYFFILASVKIDRMLGLFFFPIAGPPSSSTPWAYATKHTYEQQGM